MRRVTLLGALMLMATVHSVSAQPTPSATIYLGAGPGSPTGDFGCCIGQIGVDLEAPIGVSWDAAVHIASFAVGAACASSCDLGGYLVEAGVSRVLSEGRISPYAGVTAGLYELESRGATAGARAGLQIGRRPGLRIGVRVQALAREGILVPATVGLRISF